MVLYRAVSKYTCMMLYYVRYDAVHQQLLRGPLISDWGAMMLCMILWRMAGNSDERERAFQRTVICPN